MLLDLEILRAKSLEENNNNNNQHTFIHFISSYLEAFEGEAATGY